MFELPPALGAFASFRQFIVCRILPSSTIPGKANKFPVNWQTGQLHDAHDPAIWLDHSTASAVAESFGPGHGVGFVFTTTDPFFFIDIDGCLSADGVWSPIAQDLVNRFPTAAIEISQSGRGLHIFGSGFCPPHKKRAPDNLFELYTELRFVMLTGTGARGDASTDHAPALAALVDQYLVPSVGDSFADWDAAVAAGPDPRWRASEDDAVLVDRAIKSGSAASVFGSKASFAELWFADTDALATAFPDPLRPYDASRADSALAQHLAFWTGKDCARILRLMHLSALKRPKWDDREDYYLPRTILAVVARQVDVVTDKLPEPVTGIPTPPATAPRGTPITGETFLDGGAQVGFFGGCIYVTDRHRVLVPGGHLYDPQRFRTMFGGYTYVLDAQNSRVTHNAWEAFTESQLVRAPRADTLCFRPDRPPAEIVSDGGYTSVNVWWPVQTECIEGDAGPFTRHVAKLLPDAGDYAKLMAYLAAIVQYPGVKFQWAPVLQGVEGNGKTIIGRVIAHCVGDRYTHIPNIDDLADGMKFTAWVERKLFILLEEIHTKDKGSLSETLKPLITNSRIEIQAKGVDQVTGDNRANVLAMSNHKNAVPTTDETRRWAIFFTAQQHVKDLKRDGLDGDYFPDFWDWLEGRNAYANGPPGKAIANHFLRNYKIPDELNPAVGAHRAPDTTSTREAKTLSLGSIEQEVQEAIEQGLPGFIFPWVSSIKLDELIRRLRAERMVPPNKRRELMIALGYDWHPALADTQGRINNNVSPDNGKPRLFIKTDHMLAHALTTSPEVAMHYTKSQTEPTIMAAKFRS